MIEENGATKDWALHNIDRAIDRARDVAGRISSV
jgi:hypothetical protein